MRQARRVCISHSDKIAKNGLDHVSQYVARLVKSSSARCSLIIGSTDHNKACLIIKADGQVKIFEHIHLTPSSRQVRRPFKRFVVAPSSPEPEKEQAIRELFTDLQIAPLEDRVHDYNGYADAMRDLIYPIDNEIGQATMIIQRLLREVHRIQAEEGLEFLFQE